MKNKDKIGQYGQNWTIWTKLDNKHKIGQYGQNILNWTKCTKLDKMYLVGQCRQIDIMTEQKKEVCRSAMHTCKSRISIRKIHLQVGTSGNSAFSASCKYHLRLKPVIVSEGNNTNVTVKPKYQ